jgi:hypothetical protein
LPASNSSIATEWSAVLFPLHPGSTFSEKAACRTTRKH